jgi:hypothetical protein
MSGHPFLSAVSMAAKAFKWCGGCHDPAVLYSGMMDTPIKQIVHRPESESWSNVSACLIMIYAI